MVQDGLSSDPFVGNETKKRQASKSKLRLSRLQMILELHIRKGPSQSLRITCGFYVKLLLHTTIFKVSEAISDNSPSELVARTASAPPACAASCCLRAWLVARRLNVFVAIHAPCRLVLSCIGNGLRKIGIACQVVESAGCCCPALRICCVLQEADQRWQGCVCNMPPNVRVVCQVVEGPGCCCPALRKCCVLQEANQRWQGCISDMPPNVRGVCQVAEGHSCCCPALRNGCVLQEAD